MSDLQQYNYLVIYFLKPDTIMKPDFIINQTSLRSHKLLTLLHLELPKLYGVLTVLSAIRLRNNPIALGTAKTLWSFGRSECSKVKK